MLSKQVVTRAPLLFLQRMLLDFKFWLVKSVLRLMNTHASTERSPRPEEVAAARVRRGRRDNRAASSAASVTAARRGGVPGAKGPSMHST